MQPRLAAISGKLRGSVFTIESDAVVIGRESTVGICIPDGSVSRRHSQIERSATSFEITDLQSLNGTFVNEVPVNRRTLQHGDRIRIGESQFLFLLHDDDLQQSTTQVVMDDRLTSSGSTIQFPLDQAVYLMARDLSALMKISTTINSIHGLEQLQHRLLELLFEVVPADRGAILLTEIGSQEFQHRFGLDRHGNVETTIAVSRTIARQVITDRVAMLCNDPAQNAAAESLIAMQTTSVMCVPLVMVDRPLGVVYLDSKDQHRKFDKDHLELVSAISGIAAVAIENAKHVQWLESENQRLRADALDHNMIGESAAVKQVYAFIARVSPTDSTVLIRGESGTGKELAARAIHQNSKRADKPFIAVNCAALSESLLESELFGHEKGAFTGALTQRKGRLEIADGGTLFLDEIGELTPALQVKLLRVLQEREFERVGGTRTIKIDIRLVAATNKNLEDAIAQGLFRRDLYYRLNVVAIELPALRNRAEDIPLLARYFAARYAEKCNRRVTGLSPEATARLKNYEWPGNVRELENAIERAVVLGTTEAILADDLPDSLLETQVPTGATSTNYHENVGEAKKQIILRAMVAAKGNYTEAAKLLAVHPNYLHRLIRNFNLKTQIEDGENG